MVSKDRTRLIIDNDRLLIVIVTDLLSQHCWNTRARKTKRREKRSTAAWPYRSSKVALTRTSASQLWLDVVLGQGESWRASVNDTADALAVRLSKGRDAKVGSKGRHG